MELIKHPFVTARLAREFVDEVDARALHDLDAALDEIFDNFDDLAREDRFLSISVVFEAVDADRARHEILIGYLSATVPMKNEIAGRDVLVRKIEARLLRDGFADVLDIMRGLK